MLLQALFTSLGYKKDVHLLRTSLSLSERITAPMLHRGLPHIVLWNFINCEIRIIIIVVPTNIAIIIYVRWKISNVQFREKAGIGSNTAIFRPLAQ